MEPQFIPNAWPPSAFHADPKVPKKQQQANLSQNKQLCPHGTRQLPPHHTQETLTQQAPIIRMTEATTLPIKHPIQLGTTEATTPPIKHPIQLGTKESTTPPFQHPIQLGTEEPTTPPFQHPPPPPSTRDPNNHPPPGTEGNDPEVNQQTPLHFLPSIRNRHVT